MVRGAAEAMGTQSILRDMGVTLKIRLKEDSSAAKGIAERTGLGKLRHVEVNQLWVQEKVKNKVIELTKVKGVDNLADALTKYVGNEDLGKHMRGTHVKVEWGRHEIMPEVTEEIQELPEGLEMGGRGIGGKGQGTEGHICQTPLISWVCLGNFAIHLSQVILNCLL